MSKYLRTKDGIYENKPLEKHLGKRKGKGYEIVFREQDIINQADTIEELCDEYVVVTKDNKPVVYRDFIRDRKPDITDIYGAIWTDKGLQYVARMNNEGELELI